MSNIIYWGENGQYGPFDIQADGWPNAGQVMRYFREKKGITAKAFGKLYGKMIRENGKSISERWILEMELENAVPTDIARRRVIAQILGIPPILFGLASLETVTIQPQSESNKPILVTRENILRKFPTDITNYEKNIRMALHLHRTSNAQDLIQDINVDIRNLSSLVNQAKGDFLYKVGELLIGNELLATKIVKDQRRYALAYIYANNAVQVAKKLEDIELLASTKYIRGCVNLEWGLFGKTEQGSFQLNVDKVKSAISDLRDILVRINTSQDIIHPQLHGFILLQLSRALSAIEHKSNNVANLEALKMADSALDMVGHQTIDDLYTRMLVTGTLSGLHLGGYHLIRAGILNMNRLSGQAIAELHELRHLTEQTYGRDETRNQAWSNIVMAEALIGLGEYKEASDKIKNALITCYSINSVQNITTIIDNYSKLIVSPDRKSLEVRELTDMLRQWDRH